MNPVTRKAIQAGTKANVWLYRRTNGRVGSGTGRLLLPPRRSPAGTCVMRREPPGLSTSPG